MKYIASVFILYAILGCSTTTNSDPNYYDIIKKFSDRKELHQGLMNILQIQGTFLNSTVQRAQIQKKATAFQWPASDVESAMSKMEESLRSETIIFLSFYSPNPKLDDLDKIQSVWKIYLDVNNKRYEAKAVKQSGVYDEFLELYPYHTRFGTPYKIIANVPAINIEDYPSKLVITGTLGSISIDFPGK
jgi:hypothetical protein